MMLLIRYPFLTLIFGILLSAQAGLSRSVNTGYANHELGAVSVRIKEQSYTASVNRIRLQKRAVSGFDLAGNNADDTSILTAAFNEMMELVNFVSDHPNVDVIARYFAPNTNALNDATAIFNSIRLMAGPNGHPQPAGNFAPNSLHGILVRRTRGGFPFTLADALDTTGNSVHPTINIYDYGWSSLWQRLRSGIKCSDIGPRTNYKMHFLGSLILHEILHFNNVNELSWHQARQPEDSLNDQPGSFPCLGKAYGPYESIALRRRNGQLAKLNIENYVWYALETYWANQCPERTGPNDMFLEPRSNDIPTVCKQGAAGGVGVLCKSASGALSNLWCWKS